MGGSDMDAGIKAGSFSTAREVAACPFVGLCSSEFFEKHRPTTETHRWHFANVPSPDFIGSKYRGLVVIGGNPGLAHHGIHYENDKVIFNLQRRIAQGDQEAFDALLAFMPSSMAHWPQVVNNDGRRRLEFNIDEIAYIDIVKCGTAPAAGDTAALLRGTGILKRCWQTHTHRLLELLAPTHVLALWSPIPRVLRELGYPLEDKVVGHYTGARHLTSEAKYASARQVVDDYYGRR